MFVRAWLAVVVVVVECDNCSERGHDERLQRGFYTSRVVLGTYFSIYIPMLIYYVL